MEIEEGGEILTFLHLKLCGEPTPNHQKEALKQFCSKQSNVTSGLNSEEDEEKRKEA